MKRESVTNVSAIRFRMFHLKRQDCFFHTFGEGRTYMLKDMSIKVQVFLDISRNAATFGDMEYALKRIG